jgi:hypothetical protein
MPPRKIAVEEEVVGVAEVVVVLLSDGRVPNSREE